MSNRILAGRVSLLVFLAFTGLSLGQGSPPEPRGTVELFQPDAPAFSAAEDAEGERSPASSGKRLVLVNTRTHLLFMTLGGRVVFQARCSTGKGTTLTTGDETRVFETPRGDFLIQSKEENPAWIPPDWYFVEEARKRGLRTIRLQPGRPVPLGADTGLALAASGAAPGGQRLEVRRDTVVRVSASAVRELPPGRLIRAGDAIVIPPYGTPQRKFQKVLGAYRINFGGGFGIHGTDEPEKIGQSVTHGCVRLSDADIRALYPLVEVGDEVVIF